MQEEVQNRVFGVGTKESREPVEQILYLL